MNDTTLLDLFRSFYYRNYPESMERCVELFSIFGALDITLDSSKPTPKLIIEHILLPYTTLAEAIDDLIEGDARAARLLAALASGDRRLISLFRRARLDNASGGALLQQLAHKGIVRLEYAREEGLKIKPKRSKEEPRYRISHKSLFIHPFLRFWYHFIYPRSKEIAKGRFGPVLEDFKRQSSSYTGLCFEQLCRLLLHHHLKEEQLECNDSYWDASMEIDILARSKHQELYIAECKWTNSKINKKELSKLVQKSQALGITPKRYLLFSKRGFSKELLRHKSEDLALFSVEDLYRLLTPPSDTSELALLSFG